MCTPWLKKSSSARGISGKHLISLYPACSVAIKTNLLSLADITYFKAVVSFAEAFITFPGAKTYPTGIFIASCKQENCAYYHKNNYNFFKRESHNYLPQHCLYFFPLPQGQGSLRPVFGEARTIVRWEIRPSSYSHSPLTPDVMPSSLPLPLLNFATSW